MTNKRIKYYFSKNIHRELTQYFLPHRNSTNDIVLHIFAFDGWPTSQRLHQIKFNAFFFHISLKWLQDGDHLFVLKNPSLDTEEQDVLFDIKE